MSTVSPFTTAAASLVWFACVFAFGWSYLSIPPEMPVSVSRRVVRLTTGTVAGVGMLGITISMLTFLVVLIVLAFAQLFS